MSAALRDAGRTAAADDWSRCAIDLLAMTGLGEYGRGYREARREFALDRERTRSNGLVDSLPVVRL